MSPTPLPQELIDQIIDHLHDDPPALSSCALVCNAWLPPSRHHFFAKITLKAMAPNGPTSCPQERCKRLYWLLIRSPKIIPNVRELEVCEGSPYPGPHPDTRSTTWVTTERTLPPLLKLLTHLKRLDFSATTTFYWKTLPPTFQNAIHAVLSLSSLTYVRFHSWSFSNFASLASLLSHCHTLKGLALSSTTVSDDATVDQEDRLIEEDESAESQTPRLEVLTLDYVSMGYLGHWLLGQSSPMDLSSLRELRVSHFPDASVIKKLLLAVGGALEHFHLKPGTWPVQSFDLGHNCGLRSIRLTLDVVDTAIDWATTLLSSVTSRNALESIGLEFYVDLKRLEGWSSLSALLVQPELASLQQVEIGLFASPTHAEFIKVKEELSGVEDRCVVRLYQLGLKSQRSNRQLTPRISRYEA